MSPRQPTQIRALRNIRNQGLSCAKSSGVHDIWTLRATRSGCGIIAVNRPSGVVTAVSPPGDPFGFAGYVDASCPAPSTKTIALGTSA